MLFIPLQHPTKVYPQIAQIFTDSKTFNLGRSLQHLVVSPYRCYVDDQFHPENPVVSFANGVIADFQGEKIPAVEDPFLRNLWILKRFCPFSHIRMLGSGAHLVSLCG
jgi:hypothetical protein